MQMCLAFSHKYEFMPLMCRNVFKWQSYKDKRIFWKKNNKTKTLLRTNQNLTIVSHLEVVDKHEVNLHNMCM